MTDRTPQGHGKRAGSLPHNLLNAASNEKPAQVHIISRSSNESASLPSSPHSDLQPTSWRPSLLRLAPLTGLAALAFAFLQIFASYALLQASDNKPVEHWKFQPSVYLAILTAISNKALAFAAVQGTVVTFWLRALRGTSLSQLHLDWSFGLHVYKALLAGRRFNMLALACICATFVADGPLLQRSSTVQLQLPQDNYTLSVSVTPELPSYATGFSDLQTHEKILMGFTEPFQLVVKGYAGNSPIHDGFSGCPSGCVATIHAPALALDYCESHLEYVNFSKPFTPAQSRKLENGGILPSRRDVFSVEFGIYNGTREKLAIQTAILEDPPNNSCAGHVNHSICYYESAIGEYSVTVENGVLSLDQPHPYPKIVAKANNTALTSETVAKYGLYTPELDLTRTTLGGIANAAMYQFRMSTGMGVAPGTDVVILMSQNTATMNLFGFQHQKLRTDYTSQCAQAFTDPSNQILAALNELMFRSGFFYAQYIDDNELENLLDKELNVHTNVSATPITKVNVFKSDFNFFAGAAVLELFTILAILFTFWGYWNMGRAASFSPLEIAKAFNAPLLHDAGSNQSGKEIAKDMKDRIVQYGILKETFEANSTTKHVPTEKLGISDADRVDRPSGEHLTLREHRDRVHEYYSQMRKKYPRGIASTATNGSQSDLV